jgi:beta-galactosidase
VWGDWVLKKTFLLALSLWCAFALSSPANAQAAAAQSLRQTIDLSTGWRFRFGDAGEAPAAPVFDDSAWEQVSVPHTWNRIGEYALTRGAATNNAQGVGWYRLNYQAPAAAPGKRQYLDFAAVGAIADVWVNGVHQGQHKGAYSRFRFDVTEVWKPGAVNVIAVKADNSKPAVGSTTQDVLPLSGDFFIHGGIYRGVLLITANDVGIDLLDMGGSGVYVRDLGAASDKGMPVNSRWIEVRSKLRNFGNTARRLSAAVTIADANGKVVSSGMISTRVAARQTASVGRNFEINDPILWNGKANPYHYSISVAVQDGKRSVDSVTVPFGIRTVTFDPKTGVTLNGKPIKLHGVSRHQDRLGKGYALSREDHAEDMATMQEMGVNAVRHAHYQHADEWADEADKAGMLVWAEVPYVTTPSLTGGEGSPALFANAEQQMRELIRQNYNHPSIVMWSIGNEVDASALFGLGGGPTKPLALLQHLQKVAKEEDPSRPTTFADCCEDVSSPIAGLSGQLQGDKLAGAADLIGYNRYYGWYYPEPLKAAEQLAAQMDKFHAKHPTLPISVSEYGAGGAVNQHSDNPTTGFVNAIGRPQPEAYESWVHEQSWPVIRDRPFIYGSFVWNMFDFASDLRNEGDSVDINTKGLVTFDRKVKKDAFYYYQAQWSEKPMAHITGKLYRDRPYPVMEVRAYSNADKLSLMVEGQNLGEVPCSGRICVWPNVALKPGPNQVAVWGTVGGAAVGDKTTWNGPDPAQGIRINVGDIASGVIGNQRFGSDNFVSGGTTAVLNQGGLGGRRSGPLRTVIAGDPALYDYWREGEAFSYAVPVPNGKWTVTIHTFEPRAPTETGAQAMSISAQGKLAVRAFNIAQAAGGQLKALTRSFPVKVKDGVLKLDFAGTAGKAVVAAIEVTK